MSTTIYINGVDQTTNIEFRSVTVDDEIISRKSSMDFEMKQLSSLINQGDLVEMWEDTTLLFSGLVFDSNAISPVPEKRMVIEVTNWYDRLLQRFVRKTYENETLWEVIKDIVETRVHPDELKLMLQFEEGTGTTAQDSSQFDNDGTLNGGVTWDVPNRALVFDGLAGSFLSVADDGSLDFARKLSICIEFTMDNLNETIISKDSSSAGGLIPYRITVDASGDVIFQISDSSNSFSISTTDAPIVAGTKYTIVCTFDADTGIGSIYVDGALNISGTLTTNSIVASTGNLVIGAVSESARSGVFGAVETQFVVQKSSPGGTPEPNFDGTVFRASLYADVLTFINVRAWHIDAFEVKTPERIIAASTSIVDRMPMPFLYPAESFDQLAKRFGLEIRVDPNAFVHFIDKAGGSVVATFDEDDGTIVQHKTDVKVSTADVRNAIYVRGGSYFDSWRNDVLEGNGANTVFALPYKYSQFEMFTDEVASVNSIQSKYKMDDASGNLADVMSANILTAANLTYSQTGQIDDAIDFNGTTSSARKAGATHDTGDTAHAITAIVNPDVHDTTERVIAGFGDFSAGHSKISLIKISTTFYVRHNFGDSIVTDTDIGDISGAFHMIGISYNPIATGGPTLKVYLDGTLMSTTIVTTPDIDAGVVELGGNNGSNVFDGDIDEVTFFQYSLSDQEHEGVYNLAFTSQISALLLNSGIEFLDDIAGFDALYNFSEKNYKFTTAPVNGTNLYPTGMPEAPIQVLRTDQTSIDLYGRREHQILDKTIESTQAARDRATAELAKRRNGTEIITFDTHTSGINTGVTIALTLPSFGINEGNFFVQKVTILPWLPVENAAGKKFVYRITCVNVISRKWVDFLRNAFTRDVEKIDPSEGEAIQDIVDHAETIDIDGVHTVATPTAHAETVEIDDAHTPDEIVSGGYKWSNDGGTTPDKLRWNLGDWG